MTAGTLKRASVLAAGLLGLFAATALATGNFVAVHAPGHAKANVPYSIKLSGHAKRTERLYMFVDYHRCLATPAAEHARANGDIWTVTGDFSLKSSGWSSPVSGKDHVCAYLVKASEPKNPSGGVLAADFVTYRIH